MAERFAPGDGVRALAVDAPGHARLPRYVRGRPGVIVSATGQWPRPEDVIAGSDAPPQTVYTVRFAANDLWHDGDHSVFIDLWEGYLVSREEQ